MEKRERFEFNAGQRPGAVSSVSARRGSAASQTAAFDDVRRAGDV